MKKRFLSMLLGTVLVAANVVGLWGNGVAEVKAESGDKVIKWAIAQDKTDALPAELISRFEEQYPEYTLEVIEATGTDQWTKLTMMMQSPETCPDVIAEDGFMLPSDSAAGYLYPLDDFAAGWDEYDQIYDSFKEGGKGADGKLYGIFTSTDVMAIWYNKELFKGAGIEVPWQPKNWDDIITAAEALKATYGETVEDFIPVFMHSSKTNGEHTSMRTFQIMYNSTGGKLYDAESGKWVYDKENLTKVFNFINDIYNEAKAGAPYSIVSTAGVDDLIVNDYIPNGKCGMYFWGSWIASSWLETGTSPWPEALDTMGVAAVPAYDGDGLWTIGGGWTWAIPANAPNKENAEFFLEWLCSYDQQMLRNDGIHSGDMTVRSDIAADPSYGADPATFIKETSEYLPYVTFRPGYDGYSTVSIMYAEMTEAVAIGTYTPEEAVEAFYNELVRLVGEEKVLVEE